MAEQAEAVPSPIPADLAEDLDATLEHPEVTPNVRWIVERLVESGYARGYHDGHVRGWRGGDATARRRIAMAPPSPMETMVEPALTQLEDTSWTGR